MSDVPSSFGEGLIRYVRDETIDTCDSMLRDGWKGEPGPRWRSLFPTEQSREAFREALIDVVDQTLAQLLDAVDQELVESIPPSEADRGELSGWYFGDWVGRFSKRPFHDDLTEAGVPPATDESRRM